MILTRITDAAEEPLTLTELKNHLRVEHAVDDALVTRLAKTARQQVERITGWALLTQTWRQSLNNWEDGPVRLRVTPAASVTNVSVVQEDGSEEVIPASSYHLNNNWLNFSGTRPAPGTARAGIRIEFIAGHVAASDVPEGLRQATALLTAHYYERREPVENGVLREVPDSVAALVQPFREVRL